MSSSFKELLEWYLRARTAYGIARGTLNYERLYLTHFVSWLLARGITAPVQVTPQNIETYRAELLLHRYKKTKAPEAPWKPLAPKTVADRMVLVCEFFHWLTEKRFLLGDPALSCVIRFPKKRLPENVLSEAQVCALLAACDMATPKGFRNRAILELLYSSGLRRAEIAALDLTDLDLAAGTVFVRHGKGGKPRVVPLGDEAAKSLLAYVEHGRPFWLRNPHTTALFIGSGGPSGSLGSRLSPVWISELVGQAAARAGINRRVTAHALRHSMATHLVRAGADIRHVQEILGHSDVTTTEIYTHVAARDLREVHAKTHPRGHLRLDRPKHPA